LVTLGGRSALQEDDTEGVARLLEESDALERVARAAARAPAEPGSDGTGSVTVTLDERGLVATVTVDAGWRQRVPRDRLGDAVIEAVSDASARRLAAWGAAFDEGSDDPVDDLPRETGHGPVAGGVAWDRGDVQRR
jgi:hypothetical protein